MIRKKKKSEHQHPLYFFTPWLPILKKKFNQWEKKVYHKEHCFRATDGSALENSAIEIVIEEQAKLKRHKANIFSAY